MACCTIPYRYSCFSNQYWFFPYEMIYSPVFRICILFSIGFTIIINRCKTIVQNLKSRIALVVPDCIAQTEVGQKGVDLRFGHRTTAMRNYVNLAVPTMPLLVADKRGAAETKIIANSLIVE